MTYSYFSQELVQNFHIWFESEYLSWPSRSTHGRGSTQHMTDFNTSGSYYIRDNLKAALLRFRNPEKDVDIWVDALCIDQDNKVEKKAQVARSKHFLHTFIFSLGKWEIHVVGMWVFNDLWVAGICSN